jgi:hypothetical protein
VQVFTRDGQGREQLKHMAAYPSGRMRKTRRARAEAEEAIPLEPTPGGVGRTELAALLGEVLGDAQRDARSLGSSTQERMTCSRPSKIRACASHAVLTLSCSKTSSRSSPETGKVGSSCAMFWLTQAGARARLGTLGLKPNRRYHSIRRCSA